MDTDNTSTYRRLAKISNNPHPTLTYGLKVGIIIPPSPFVVPLGWEFVHKAPFEGPSVIAAVLKGLGHNVNILDQRENFNPEALRNGPLNGFDVICITTYPDNFPYIKKAAQIAKEESPSRPVILGGPLVTSAPKLVMDNTAADLAVIGEGELTVIELFDILSQAKGALPKKEILGLAWKDADGTLVLNPKRPQMCDLDAVPIQDLSVWPATQKTGEVPEIYMSSSRGCAGNCRFCYRAMPELRHKSPARVRRELMALKKYNFRHVWWSDLTFIDSKERVHRLMDEAFSGIDFRWNCFSRVDTADLDVLKHMKQMGCDIVLYGFESITPEILEHFKKRISRHQIVEAITLTRQAGIKVGGLFIIGAPGETKESLWRLIDFCRQFKDVTRVKYLSALPGTRLYDDALSQGIIKDELKHLYFLARERSVEDDEIINFTDMPEEELRRAYAAINRNIELRPYEYWNTNDHYLEKPQKFKLRG